MSQTILQQNQEDNAGRLVMKTFFRVMGEEGATSSEVVQYLRSKFGDVWNTNVLTGIAEDTLNKTVTMGFLDRLGDRFILKLARDTARCGRRPRCCKRKRCCRRRRRSRRRRRRRSRRRRRCCK